MFNLTRDIFVAFLVLLNAAALMAVLLYFPAVFLFTEFGVRAPTFKATVAFYYLVLTSITMTIKLVRTSLRIMSE